MNRRITIDPVTRIEGHAKITIHLDESGAVADARFHVTEFRGFEGFCVGRPFWEMPALTSRICGICPVSHLLASAKAGDAILAVSVPPAAIRLRRICNLAQIIQSHALSFFHLSAPDLIFGMEPASPHHNFFGLIAQEPEFARGGIRLRRFGQEVIERLGGRKIHPAWAVPGGVWNAWTDEDQAAVRASLGEMIPLAEQALARLKGLLDRFADELAVFGNFPTHFLALARPEDGGWEHYHGVLRIVAPDGEVVVEGLDPARYGDVLAEHVENDSFLKSPYYRPLGYPDGIYRVGPLARLNVATSFGVARADRELREFRQRFGPIAQSSFLYHYARLIEILGSLEWIERHLDEETGGDARLRARGNVNQLHGVGVGEAPRGTLFHDYRVDETGVLVAVNLLIATGQNNLAMNRTVAQIARHYLKGPEIPAPLLNRVEAGIRAFDPCLSCSTHAVGMMPLVVRLFDAAGRLLDEKRRGVDEC